jgi:hypothetical protein
MVLTVRGIGRGSGAAVPAVRSRGGVRSESGKEQLRGASGLLDPVIRRVESLRRFYGGSGRVRDHRRREIERRSYSPAAGRGLKSGVGMARTGASELGGGSWARGGAPAGVVRGWEAVAWLVRGGAEAWRGRAARMRRLGLVAALRGEMVGAEVPRGPIKGRAGSGRPCRGAHGRGSRREARLG